MSPEQITQITQVAFVLILIVPTIVTVGVGVYVAMKIVPANIRQSQQLIDNNTKLTKISEQNIDQIKINAEHIKVMEAALSGIQPELIKQTNVIREGNIKTDELGLHFRNYQTLMSDGMAAQTAELAAYADAANNIADTVKGVSDNQKMLTEIWKTNHQAHKEATEDIKTAIETFSIKGSVPVGLLTEAVARMERMLDALPRQLVLAIQDESTCAAILKEFQALRFEVKQALNQQTKRITGTIPTVPSPPPTEGSTN